MTPDEWNEVFANYVADSYRQRADDAWKVMGDKNLESYRGMQRNPHIAFRIGFIMGADAAIATALFGKIRYEGDKE